MTHAGEQKTCASCGRSFSYRRKWERTWTTVKYCSDECRRNRQRHDYRREILDLLSTRTPGATICPSEVLPVDDKQNAALMEHVRRSARLLAAEGKVELTQRGRAVDPQQFKGPIRLRLLK